MNSGDRRPEDTHMEPGTRHQSSGSCGMWRSGCPQSRSPFVCLSLRKVCTPQSAQRDHASSWRQRGTPGKGRMDWGGPPGRRTVSSAGKEQRQQTRGTREDFGKCWDQATCQLCVLWQMVWSPWALISFVRLQCSTSSCLNRSRNCAYLWTKC